MKGIKAASRYAKALLELAIEHNKVAQISEDMRALAQAHKETREFQLFLDNPVINADKKTAVLNALFGQFDPITTNFVELIAKNRRESILPAIAYSFEAQVKAHEGIVPVTLISAQPLDSKTKEDILAKVQASVQGTVELNEQIDASLLGGFIVRMGDTQIDASVASQLKNLKQRLTH